MVLWPFIKYVGCGNDFILFDNQTELFPSHNVDLIQRLCHRQWGIGADGIILLEPAKQADFRMRIFNADGHEAEMCGNGIRCLLKFIRQLGFSQPSYYIQTMAGKFKVSHQEKDVCIEMGELLYSPRDLFIEFENRPYTWHYVEVGVPHAILFVDDLVQINLANLGPYIRRHPSFYPKGTNVNIAQLISKEQISIRTYERGVEAETLACGTGATAVALSAAYYYQLKSPLYVQTLSQEILKIEFSLHQQKFSNITLAGPAHSTYRGEIFLS